MFEQNGTGYAMEAYSAVTVNQFFAKLDWYTCIGHIMQYFPNPDI